MFDKRSVPTFIIVTAAAAVVLAACAADERGDNKSGGSADPVVLTMADTYSGFQYEPAVQFFVDQVGELSDAAVRIDARHEIGEYAADAEQQVVRGVASGEFDLAWVGTRVFDTLGVNSFRALSAPMLIDNYPLQQAVIESDIPGDMLAGLDEVGVTGIAVLADGLRKPIAVNQPLTSPADFDGVTFQSFRSTTQADAIRALGANPIEVWSGGLDSGLQSGEIDGFEKNLHIYHVNETSHLAPYVTANVNLWPQTVALIANPDTMADLSDTQREWLMQAATDAAENSTDLADNDAETLTVLCQTGARFANASAADLDALREAFAPVYATLEQNPETKEFIDRIDELKRATDPGASLDVPAECTGPPPVQPAASSEVAQGGELDAEALDGIYRREVTEAELVDAGIDEDTARAEAGLYTFTLDGGNFLFTTKNDFQLPDCEGTYSGSGAQVTFVNTNECGQGPFFTATWTFDGEALRFENVEAGPVIVPVIGGQPWTRIGDRPGDDDPAADPATLNGTYRWTITRDDALANGTPEVIRPENLATLPLIFTVTLDDGTCQLDADDGYSDTCTYVVDGDRMVVDWASGVGPFEYTFTQADDGTLQFRPAGPMPDGDAFVGTTKPWEKID